MSPDRNQDVNDQPIYGAGSQFYEQREYGSGHANVRTETLSTSDKGPANAPSHACSAKLTAEALDQLNKQYMTSGAEARMRTWLEDRNDFVVYLRGVSGAPKGV